MFALVIWVCAAAVACEPTPKDYVFVGQPMSLRQCRMESTDILNAMPALPDGQRYSAACAGINRV